MEVVRRCPEKHKIFFVFFFGQSECVCVLCVNRSVGWTGRVVQIEELRAEIGKRDQELLATGAKMKTLEEQHQDYQRHIAVLKESLCAKEEHYNMLQTDVSHQRHLPAKLPSL